jgi:ATP-binding cassette, subfamily B, bacterial MsbA
VTASDRLLSGLGFTPDFISVLVLATVVICFGACLTYIASLFSTNLTVFTIKSIKKRLISDVLNRPYLFFTQVMVGKIVAVITEQAGNSASTIDIAFRVLTALMLSVGFLVSLFLISIKLTISLGVMGIVVIATNQWLYKKNEILSRIWNDLKLDLSAFFTETVVGIKTVKVMGLEKYQQENAESLLSRERDISFKSRVFFYLSPLFVQISSTIIGAITIYLGTQVFSLTGAEVLVFLIMVSRFNGALNNANTNWLLLVTTLPNVDYVLKYLDYSGVKNTGQDIFKLREKVEIKDISFSYGEKNVLRNINLTIHRNRFFALVGPSGGGKSTLVDLIIGLHEPETGQILFDDKTKDSYKHEDWCSSIGMVSQDIFLFNDTIAKNIAYGAEVMDMAKVKEVAKLAHAESFINDCSDKYDTILGDRGVKLSGGQRQRIALARCLYHNPKLLILDEATSALDSESEKYIQEALNEMYGKMTIIAVAHRLSTIREADCIVYIEDGSIKEMGTHDELIQKSGGLYKKLKKIQSK